MGGEGIRPVLKACPSALGVGCSPTWYLLGSGINFVSITGNPLKEHTDILTQKHKICYLWACTVRAINHYVSCHLKPITPTHNLFFSLFFQVISKVIGEKHSVELPVTVH